MMVIKLIEDQGLWDKHIEDSAYGTLFHKWDFLKIIEKHSESKLYPYGVFRGDELTCLFPLFVKQFMGLRMIFSPPPGLAVPYLGFAMVSTYDRLKQRRKESYINSVADEMEEEIKKLHPNFVYMSTVNRFPDVRPFRWNGYEVQMNYSYVIDLKRPLDDIRNDFDAGLKSAIAVSEKLPLSVRPAEDVDQFYSAMQSRFRSRRETPPVASKEYLRDVLKAFPDNIKINFLYNGNDIVVPFASYQYKKRSGFWVWLARPDEVFHSSEFCAWDLIKAKKAEGMESLEMPGAGIRSQYMLKSRFNAPLVYNFSVYRKDLAGRMGESLYANVIKIRA